MPAFLVYCNQNRAGAWYPTGVGDVTLEDARRRAAMYQARNPGHEYQARQYSAPTPASCLV